MTGCNRCGCTIAKTLTVVGDGGAVTLGKLCFACHAAAYAEAEALRLEFERLVAEGATSAEAKACMLGKLVAWRASIGPSAGAPPT